MSEEEVEISVIEDVDDKSDVDILVELIEENRGGLRRLAEEKPAEESRDKNEKSGDTE